MKNRRVFLSPGGKVQPLKGPCYPAGGHGDGAALATAELGCPVPPAASQTFAFSYSDPNGRVMKRTAGYTISGTLRRKQERIKTKQNKKKRAKHLDTEKKMGYMLHFFVIYE